MTAADEAKVTIVVVADDHTLFRQGLRELLSTDPEFDVIGEAAHGDEAVALVQRYRPQVLLLDVEMPGPGAKAVIERVRRTSAETAVVILTMHDAPALVRDLLDCGAAAYLVKSIARDELIAAIRSVSRASGNVLLSIPRATVESLERQQEQRGMLSKRELEVFGAFTYIAFTLTQVSGFATSTVPWLLVLFGVGTFAGNFLGGKAADRSLDKSLLVILALLTAVLTAFALTAHNQVLTVISLFLMGTVGLATAPGLQLRIMRYAEDAPTMASGANIAAFNVGNALGAWLSGLALAAGLGFVSPLWVGAAVNLVGLVVLAGGTAAARRHQPPVTSAAPQDAPQAVTT